jgi:hypothetical protein
MRAFTTNGGVCVTTCPFLLSKFEFTVVSLFIQIDCWPSSYNLDENGRALVQAAFQNEVDTLPPKTKKKGFLVGGCYSEIHKVLPERAEALAAKLFGIWEQYNKPSPNLTREQ